MTEIIVEMIGKELWITIFVTSFFLGLFLLLIVLLTTFHSHHIEFDKSFHHLDLSHDIHDMDVHSDAHIHIDHLDNNLEHEVNSSALIDMIGIEQESQLDHIEIQSKYLLGNLSVYMLFFGQIGWFNINEHGDIAILTAIFGGLIAAKIFSWLIRNYAKTVIVPIHQISRGDIGKVIFGLDYENTGLVNVTRKDQVISTVIAKGAYPYDNFVPGELGYIWSKNGGIYTLTKGRLTQNKSNVKKKSNEINQFDEA